MGVDEEFVVRMLVAEGIVSADELQELASTAARDGKSLLEWLLAGGRVSGATVATLRARLNGADPAEQALDSTALEIPRPRPRDAQSAVGLGPALANGDDGEDGEDEFPFPAVREYGVQRISRLRAIPSVGSKCSTTSRRTSSGQDGVATKNHHSPH